MVVIEELLFELEKRLEENGIKKKDIDKYMYVYILELEELKRLLSIDWNDRIILENLIKSFSCDSENEDERIECLKYVSDNTDIRVDEAKILACTDIIKKINLFKGDKDCLFEIINKIMNAKTEEGMKVASYVTKDILEYLNEEDYAEETLRRLRIRLSEIVGFITRFDEVYKVNAAKEIVDIYPKEKLGNLCMLLALMDSAKDEKHVHAIIDVSRKKGMRSANLDLVASLKSLKMNDEKLEELYQILSYADQVSLEDLSLDLDNMTEDEENKLKSGIQRKKNFLV